MSFNLSLDSGLSKLFSKYRLFSMQTCLLSATVPKHEMGHLTSNSAVQHFGACIC